MNKIIILIGVLALVFLVGCKTNSFTVKDLLQSRLDSCRENLNDYAKETGALRANCVDKSHFANAVDGACVLIVTEGEEPTQSQNEILNRQYVFPVRTWNFSTDQIEDRWDTDDGIWKYWLYCPKKWLD